ncbi:hypothetical protein IFM89_008768, partial [Coptis chinensis]
MFGFRKLPNIKVVKQNSVEPGFLGSSNSNPFDSDLDSDAKKTFTHARRELEGYATYKAEETTKSVDSCLKIAEYIRDDATKTLITLHQQGEQITRTHEAAANIDQDLSRGEKLLGSLGGMFSKTWKPKKTKAIKGPMIHLKEGEITWSKGRSWDWHQFLREDRTLENRHLNPQLHYRKLRYILALKVEKTKQDNGLNDLSDILGELKVMAVDMGSEIERCVLDPIVHSCGNRAVCDDWHSELIPCLDKNLIYQMRLKLDLSLMEHYERHCPLPKRRFNCLIPPPTDYKVPVKWPRSRDEVWKANIPHTHLAHEKSDQNWMVEKGEKIIFPGGGTHFHYGADMYIALLAN